MRALLCLLLLPSLVTGRAILGIDLGSSYMKVALVQSGSPLEIVTNLHSKRKTEQLVLFDNEQRFYGADANALLARKSQKTPAAMSVLLGRHDDHPAAKVLSERHYPIRPSYNETRSGVAVSIQKDGTFTPEELVAMVLEHAVEISVAHAKSQGHDIAPPRDCVLTVPSFATALERRAWMDAAELAHLNVLTLIDENTAAALHYGMDKTFEQEQTLLFYNMGASSVQVSIVKFFNYEQPQKYGKPKTTPALEVVSKAWDATLGGLAFDHVITEHLADVFNHAWHAAKPNLKDKNVRDVPAAMTKLRLQAMKIKEVLSANQEIPVYMDAVVDDISLQTKITRTQFEELCASLFDRAIVPVFTALNIANMTVDDLTGIELVGGGMRIPRIQNELNIHLQKELGLHMNADESFALGAAFAGANISTAFRVRAIGMTDVNPFQIDVSLCNLGQEKDDESSWNKQATIFKEWGKVGVKKTIAFSHDSDVHCALDYTSPPEGSEAALERYNITGVAEFAKEMEEKGLGKPKVSLQFELSASGITSLLKAEVTVEETYIVEEEVEIDDEEGEQGAENATEATNDTKVESKEEIKDDKEKKNDTDADAANATETKDEEPKKKKTKLVEKEKKKTIKRPLTVTRYFVGKVQPHSESIMAESKAKLIALAARDKERIMLEEARNKVESYIYKIKSMLVDDAETIEGVTNEEQRTEVQKLAKAAGEWLDDEGYAADLATLEDKYAELSMPFAKILLRIAESTARPAALEKLKTKLTEVEALMVTWTESKPHITEEEKAVITEKVEEVRKWMDDKDKAQAELQSYEDAAFFSTDIPVQFKPLEAMVVKLGRKPMPKVEKKENATGAAPEGNATDANTTTSTTTAEEEAPTDAKKDEAKKEDADKQDATDSKESVKEEL